MPNFKEAPEWKHCTPKEQKWLEAYFEPDEGSPACDIVYATQSAFNTKDEDTALSYGRDVFKRERIQRIINFVSPNGGLPTLEEFKREVWTTARGSKDAKLKFDALTLYADLEGWRVRGVQKPVKPKDASGEPGGMGALNDLTYREEE